MNGCIAAVGSSTLAIRAKKALANQAILASVVKLDPGMTKRGCSYGVEFSCSQMENARMIFGKERIKIREYIGDSEKRL